MNMIYAKKWKLYRSTRRKTDGKQDVKKAINSFDSKLHHKVTASSREGCDTSSMQQVVQNGIFYSNKRRNIGRGTSEVI